MKYLKYMLMVIALMTLTACGAKEETYVNEDYDIKGSIKLKYDKSEVKELDVVIVSEESMYSEEFDDLIYELDLDYKNGKLSKKDIEKLEYEMLNEVDDYDSENVKVDVNLKQKDDMIEMQLIINETIVNGESEFLDMPEGSTYRDYDEYITNDLEFERQ